MRVRSLLPALVTALLLSPAAARGALVTQAVTVPTGDGAVLHATVGGEGSLAPRPTIVEFTPYASTAPPDWIGPNYNSVTVQARGTGLSTGVWGAEGPRDQQDVAEVLAWACKQPWSNGVLGLYGFSASAIAVYNSLHQPLPCVKAAALGAGTDDLYRDLIYPGGILNAAPATAVGAGIGALLLGQGAGRLQEGRALEGVQSGVGLVGLFADILGHPQLDDYWTARTRRPGPNTFPILANTSFYDVESRGPFEAFQTLRRTNPGTRLLAHGAHDGSPAGTSPYPEYVRFYDRWLRGVRNGAEQDPPVSLYVGNGSREQLNAGDFTTRTTTAWPVPGTRWTALYLDAAKTPGAGSINDGTLAATVPEQTVRQAYPAIPSFPTSSDPHTTAALGQDLTRIPSLTDMTLATPLGLSFTTAPFAKDTDVVGPAALDVFFSSTAPEADLHAVVSDVRPDGTAFPVGVGRLRTSFPAIDRSRSRVVDGEVVQPYADYSRKAPAAPGQTREYHVEFWPIGNRFRAGHRLRLHLVGTSAFMLPALPGLNVVSLGGATSSRLLVPVLPAAKGKARRAAAHRR